MMSERIARVSEPSYIAFRLTVLLCAVLLGAQCVWLLLTELSRPGVDHLPTTAVTAIAAAQERDAALWAARLGAIRGDLWAHSAFTYADLLFDQSSAATTNPNLTSTAAEARLSIDQALNNAPHQSSVWLLLAGIALRHHLGNADATEALKMAYYTGPNEQTLMPLRLQIATRADRFDDVQIRDFISRELRLLLRQNHRAAITDAHNTASAAGRRLIQQTVAEGDPSFANTLVSGSSSPHSSPAKQSFPN
jgi:hypothetical protein